MQTVDFDGETLTLKWARYENGNLGLQLLSAEGEPALTASTSGPNTVPENVMWVKAYGENAGIDEALIKAGIINEVPWMYWPSGPIDVYAYRVLVPFEVESGD